MAPRFWVGGSGVWSDNTNHWSASSGGAPGASIPGGGDNVTFDSNSDVGGSPFLVTADQNTSADTFLFNTNLGQMDWDTYNSLQSVMNILDGRGASNPHLMGSGSHAIFAGAQFLTDIDYETSTIGFEGGSSSALEYVAVANDFYKIYFDTFGSAIYTFEYNNTSVMNVANEFRVKTGGTFNCVDASETDLLTLNIAGDFVLETGATFTAAPGMGINGGGDVDIHAGATFNQSTSVVHFNGTGAQSLTADESVHTFYDMHDSNTSAAVTMLTAIRVTGALAIDAGARIDPNQNDVFIRGGSGTQLTLGGWFVSGLLGVITWEINTGGTCYIPGGSGYDSNNGYSGHAILIQVIATVTTAVRLAGGLSNIVAFAMESTAAGSSATAAFYTDNYDIATYSFMRMGPDLVAEACAFTSNWGSSNIVWADILFFRWQWDDATHNLGTATFTGGIWSVYGITTDAVDTAQTFNEGTGLVTLAESLGEGWQARTASTPHPVVYDLYDVEFDNPGGTCYIYTQVHVNNRLTPLNDGSTAETSVECQAEFEGVELYIHPLYAVPVFAFYEDDTYITDIDTLDLLGTSSFDVQIRSRVGTDAARVALTNPATVSYVDVQDNNLSGALVNAYDGTNTDSGNNSANWLFTEPGAASAAYSYRRRRT